MAQSVVVLEKDAEVARSLTDSLGPHFAVHVTASHGEMRETVAESHPEAVVLDIEHWPLSDVQSLRHDFPELPIVCTHRVPDEEMWMAALEAGASDVCPSDDASNVLASVLRSRALAHRAAA